MNGMAQKSRAVKDEKKAKSLIIVSIIYTTLYTKKKIDTLNRTIVLLESLTSSYSLYKKQNKNAWQKRK